MKKIFNLFCGAAIMLCAACSGNLAEDDYAGAFAAYVDKGNVEGLASADDVSIAVVKDITVGDSIDYVTCQLAQEYNKILAEKKSLWEEKQKACEQDEKSNVLRRQEHMKNYEKYKRLYGNDLKYQSKIEGYKKAADRLPSNHEEYVEFDRRRSYSFTRDCENLKADYEEFLALGVEAYAAEAPLMQRYAERDRSEVIATVATVTYAKEGNTVKETYLFGHRPMRCISVFDENVPNIFDYKDVEVEQPEAEEENI